HVGINGPSEPTKQRQSGNFVFDCDGTGASGDNSIYVKGLRTAFVGNSWDLAYHHHVYGAWPNVSLFRGNRFSRPGFGGCALRVSAASGSFDNPAEYVVV